MAKLGYVTLSELQNMKLPFGMTIERDLYLDKDCDLIQAMEATGITPPEYILENYENTNKNKTIEIEENKNNTIDINY